MAKQLVYRGGAPNDGQGDSLYNAFKKINDNFTELYSGFVTFASNNITIANNVLFGNTSVNAVINSSSITIKSGNTITLNPTTVKVGNASVNSTLAHNSLLIRGGSANAQINSTSVKCFGSTGNATVNSTMIQVANSGGTANLQPTRLSIGATVVNTTVVSVQQVNVTSNTLTLGQSNVSSNGYTRLPNGLLYQWGMVSANSTSTKIDFPVSFQNTGAIYSLTLTPRNATYDSSYFAMVITQSASNTTIKTGNATSTNVYYTAIGV